MPTRPLSHEAGLLEQMKARAQASGGFYVMPIMGPQHWRDIKHCDAAWCNQVAIAEWVKENGAILWRCGRHPFSRRMAIMMGLYANETT